MNDSPLYKRIAEAVQQQILSGSLNAGDRLPSVRDMAKEWGCTIGTVQRAYRELARRGILTSRSGRGTVVVDRSHLQGESAMRKARLIHRAETHLLELLSAGYSLDEVEMAIRQAMDRWRVIERDEITRDEKKLQFVGSHDLIVTLISQLFPKIAPGYHLMVRYSGSLGGLIALAEGKADLAGSHLYDEESDSYNIPFVRKVLPGKRIALITLAHRRIGLIVSEGNPKSIKEIEDLPDSGIRFVNRQAGSGTRVWLDVALRKAGISSDRIRGYEEEKMTHSAAAQAVAEDKADVAIGMEASAAYYSLDFIPLTRERYDLVVLEAAMQFEAIARLQEWLLSDQAGSLISSVEGYEISETGQIRWVE
jgi:molybdate-binding protein/DNA-binding transcriptional regulator YhcF (GntR family)